MNKTPNERLGLVQKLIVRTSYDRKIKHQTQGSMHLKNRCQT